ncbi:hypothetical protein [Snodgrassella alvi]|jgi:hypothetical protein|uniref:hypothetical protein n=1 Tax=Snodgrassella alvi TaxID=1196083 RepID=UPI000C1F1AE5|nr:hypothetical protein [Snodgrassella alvi]PIT46130.1 hypothetical protein BHC51_07800 [Snodgrassella alvi]PIT48897.1 hypothetical protein BHC51_04390 [Snodgrassella alvi]
MTKNEELTLKEDSWEIERRDDGRILLFSPYEIVDGENFCLFLTVNDEEFELTDDNYVAMTLSHRGWNMPEAVIDKLNSFAYANYNYARITSSGEIRASSSNRWALLIAIHEARQLKTMMVFDYYIRGRRD